MAFENLSDKLNNVFKKLRGKGRLSESDVKEAMREVRLALLEADVSYKVVKDFVKSVSERAVGADVLESLSPAQMVIKIVNEELCALMGGQSQKLNIGSKSPSVVMLVGLQGAGKTTNGAKLAALMRKSQNKRPLLVACDVYRPAAIDQLKTVGKKLDLPVYEEGQGDPVEIAKHAIDHARRHGNDLVADVGSEVFGDEARADPLYFMRAGRAALQYGRGGGFDGDDFHRRLFLLKIPAYPRHRTARAYPRDENIRFAVRVRPDFRTRGFIVRQRIGGIDKLPRDKAVFRLRV